MAKTILGIDIGHDQLKLALVKGKRVQRVATADMPENLLRENRITSRESMAELLRTTMKQNRLHANHAAFVLPNEAVFIKNVEIPPMTVDQLVYNLPFEFNDYITGDRKEYVFDYAVVSDPEPKQAEAKSADAGDGEAAEEGEAPEPTMELMAVAAPKSLVEESRLMLHRAGLKLVKAAPTVCAFQALIRANTPKDQEVQQEYCILDLGYQSIRMYMFRGDRHMVTRVLELGMNSLDQGIAEAYSVDVHLAHTYLLTNYEDCQSKEYCMNAYGTITVELMRALNFYRFSNPDSHLDDIWICGGGACIKPLQQSIAETLDLKIHTASELIPGGQSVEQDYALLQAIGITLE